MSSAAPINVSSIAEDCVGMRDDVFRSRYGSFFLLHHGPIGSDAKPRPSQRTVIVESPVGTAASGKVEFFAFPIKESGRSPFPNFISVGRTPNNDIVIEDLSLSKFHAYFKETPNGLVIQDGGSLNGSFVNDEPVPTKEDGAPRAVAPQDRVRFGSVALTLLDDTGLRDLGRRL